MGTRGTHGTNYFTHKLNELQRGSGRLNVSRETFPAKCTESMPCLEVGKKTYYRVNRFSLSCEIDTSPEDSRRFISVSVSPAKLPLGAARR